MSNAPIGVDRQLPGTIKRGGRGGQDLVDPIRGKLEPGSLRQTRHTRAAPTGQIRYQDMGPEVTLGLIQEPPSAGAMVSDIERVTQLDAEPRARSKVPRGQPWMSLKTVGDDLGNEMWRDLQLVLVGRKAFSWLSHCSFFVASHRVL
jgi:hypothetical protein